LTTASNTVGKHGRAHAGEPPGQGGEPTVGLGQPPEALEVDPEPEGSTEDPPSLGHAPVAQRRARSPELYRQPRYHPILFLADGDLDGPVAHRQDPLVGGAVPAVHQVVGPAPECPDGQVEAERCRHVDTEPADQHRRLLALVDEDGV
jgi:hypothetical protein